MLRSAIEHELRQPRSYAYGSDGLPDALPYVALLREHSRPNEFLQLLHDYGNRLFNYNIGRPTEKSGSVASRIGKNGRRR